jgi:cytochrome c peroxidase
MSPTLMSRAPPHTGRRRAALAHGARCTVPLAAVVVAIAACRGATGQPGATPPAARIIELGRTLFFDPSLSADGRVSCATCHRRERAYTDGLAHAVGTAGRGGTRNTPSLLDVGSQRSLFWDGRRDRLEDQALDPLLNEVEHGLADEAQLLARLRADARYTPAFLAAYGVPVTLASSAQVTGALAAFERTLVSGPSPFERFLAGQRDAISEPARQGWVVFDQQAHCTRCHLVVAGDPRPLFTDHQFHSLAVGFHKVERKLPQLTQRLVALHRDGGALGRGVLNDPDVAELGRFAVTLDPHDLAAFKTPSLRNVPLTAPYMHDGSVATLGDAVDLEVYSRGALDARPVILTPAERTALIAFLETLTSEPSD